MSESPSGVDGVVDVMIVILNRLDEVFQMLSYVEE